MLAVSEMKEHYVEEAVKGADAGPSWLSEYRKRNLSLFLEHGFPSTNQEDWRFTNVSFLDRNIFHPVASAEAVAEAEVIPFRIPESTELVFVNGHFSPELSILQPSSPVIIAASLQDAIVSGKAEEYLGRALFYDENGFTYLNSAFVLDGAFVLIPKDLILDHPIHLLFLSTGSNNLAVFPRNIVSVGEQARGAIVESHVSLSDSAYFSNGLTEIHLNPSAILDHIKVQREGLQAYHIGTTYVKQLRDSTYQSTSVSLGGKLTRNNLNVLLDGEGSTCVLNGMYLVGGGQHVDNHTSIDHAKPHCTSTELYKGILDGNAHGVFNGRIIVRKDAQKTDAVQTNKNLLLSAGTLIHTKPELQILADDVKCRHGATIGKLEDAALFYIKSRGVSEKKAKLLLTYGFLADVLSLIGVKPVRAQLDKTIWNSLKERNREGQ